MNVNESRHLSWCKSWPVRRPFGDWGEMYQTASALVVIEKNLIPDLDVGYPSRKVTLSLNLEREPDTVHLSSYSIEPIVPHTVGPYLTPAPFKASRA
jgi:hypothetical protein